MTPPSQSETWPIAFSAEPRWLAALPRLLAGVHRGRPPWPWAKMRAVLWLALSIAFLCAVTT